MVDYTTNTHTFYLSAGVAATPKLRLNGLVTYNLAEGSLEEGILPEEEIFYNGVQVLAHQDFSFEEMYDYSNLDYELLRLAVGAEYQLTPQIQVTIDGELADLTDNEGYVFGNESGSFYMIRSGFRFNF